MTAGMILIKNPTGWLHLCFKWDFGSALFKEQAAGL